MNDFRAEKVCPKCDSQYYCAKIALNDDDNVVRCIYFGQLKQMLKEVNDKMVVEVHEKMRYDYENS